MGETRAKKGLKPELGRKQMAVVEAVGAGDAQTDALPGHRISHKAWTHSSSVPCLPKD